MYRAFANVLACPSPKLYACRMYSRPRDPPRFRVTVVGGAGGIGQPLSLLLRLHPLVSTLKLYDIKNAKGVAADLSHIDRPGLTSGFDGKEELLNALRCSDIVILAAGMPRKPGQSRDDLFAANACVTAEIADAVGMAAPEAFLGIITNPLNSTVPIAAEVLKKRGVYDPALLAGITTLDVVRARKFIGDYLSMDPRRIKINVIGGHSGKTIVPLVSSMEPAYKGDDDAIPKITKRIQEAGTEVVEAKGGAGSATLSMAYAAANFVNSLLVAKSEKKEVRDLAYVESCLTEAKFFASEVLIGPEGIVGTVPLPELSTYEDQLLCEALPVLLEDIEKGTDFGEKYQIVEEPPACSSPPPASPPPPPASPPPPPASPPPPQEECEKKEDPSQKSDENESICQKFLSQFKSTPCGKTKDNDSNQDSDNSCKDPSKNENPKSKN